MDSKTLWDSVLVKIEIDVTKATFSTWFKDIYISKIDSGTVYLAVPNTFVKDWLIKRFHKQILENLRSLLESVRSIEYIIAPINKKKEEFVTEIPSPNKELPLNALYINPDDNLNPRYPSVTYALGQVYLNQCLVLLQ
jgi:chromosomal replication initiation ATPase DnaA